MKAWNRVYYSDSRFFGYEPSLTIPCFGDVRANNVKSVLEIGAGRGRDTVFFLLPRAFW